MLNILFVQYTEIETTIKLYSVKPIAIVVQCYDTHNSMLLYCTAVLSKATASTKLWQRSWRSSSTAAANVAALANFYDIVKY